MRSLLYRSCTVLLLCTSLFFSSCKKFTEVPKPQNQILVDDIFTNDAAANSAVAGLYSQLMRPLYYIANTGLSIFPALSADELYRSIPDELLNMVAANDLQPNQVDVLFYLWNAGFEAIYHCNALLEGFAKPNALTPSLRQQLQGEMLFMRAFMYFYLTNLFGDVPLPLSTDYRVNAVLPRTAVAKIYDQILADLEDAIKALPAQAITTGRVRPNKWAAQALLSRVYLYLGRWEDAATTSSAVIANADFKLETTLESVFLAPSKETIWQLLPVGAPYPTQAQLFIPLNAGARPAFDVTNNLWQSFEPGDKRAQIWLRTLTIGGVTYHHPYKYKYVGAAPIVENNIVFRVAEQYLIRAEALAKLQQPEAALQDLNKIHERAGLPPLASLTGEPLLRAIEKERFVELFTEWGHRWFDLKRTGRSDAVLAPLKGIGWQSTDTLYPIPEAELLRNVYLQQNPGY